MVNQQISSEHSIHPFESSEEISKTLFIDNSCMIRVFDAEFPIKKKNIKRNL